VPHIIALDILVHLLLLTTTGVWIPVICSTVYVAFSWLPQLLDYLVNNEFFISPNFFVHTTDNTKNKSCKVLNFILFLFSTLKRQSHY